jgi:hypothetical protein
MDWGLQLTLPVTLPDQLSLGLPTLPQLTRLPTLHQLSELPQQFMPNKLMLQQFTMFSKLMLQQSTLSQLLPRPSSQSHTTLIHNTTSDIQLLMVWPEINTPTPNLEMEMLSRDNTLSSRPMVPSELSLIPLMPSTDSTLSSRSKDTLLSNNKSLLLPQFVLPMLDMLVMLPLSLLMLIPLLLIIQPLYTLPHPFMELPKDTDPAMVSTIIKNLLKNLGFQISYSYLVKNVNSLWAFDVSSSYFKYLLLKLLFCCVIQVNLNCCLLNLCFLLPCMSIIQLHFSAIYFYKLSVR